MAVTSPAHADPLLPSLVEDGAYPGAAAILAAQNVRLLAGDGHIVIADCATPPSGDFGLLKVYTTDETIGADGIGRICFKVNAAAGWLNLEVPGVYEIRGDGQRTGTGHAVTAELTTETGDEITVDVDPDGSTQVGLGADPDNPPTILLQLRTGAGPAPVTGTNAAVGKLATGQHSCTATLIAPQWVLTAASCFADNPDQPIVAAGAPATPTQITFPGHAPIAIDHLTPRTDRDLVLARLTVAIADIAPVPLATTAQSVGDSLQALGYGRTDSLWVTDAQKAATVTTTGVTETTLAVDVTAGLLCKGDGGGPAVNTSSQLVAVHSRSTQGGCLGTTSTDRTAVEIRVDDLGQWVDQQAISDVLLRGHTLKPGQRMRSNDGGYEMHMTADGNVVLNRAGQPVWNSETAGNPGSRLLLQTDGNLVVLRPDGHPLWESGTDGTPADRLNLRPDGNLILNAPDGHTYWRPPVLLRGHTLAPGQRLRSNNGAYELRMAADGDLVLSQAGQPFWSTGTGGNPGSRLIVNGEGNPVVLRPDGHVLWHSITHGTPADRLMLQSDGNLFVKGPDGQIYWRPPVLLRGHTLEPGQRLRSNNGAYEMYMQWDGNLVLYVTNGPVVWDSGTGGNPGSRLLMNAEGNPVVLRPDGQVLWHSITHGTPADRLMLRSDGNLFVKGPDGQIYWRPPVLLRGHTLEPGQRLRSNNGAYEMYMQWDGNLVLYITNGPPIWSSGTDNNPGSRLVLQTDGNLVVYRPDGRAVWHSVTPGTAADRLSLQSDGNLVLYGPGGGVYWKR